MTVQSVINVDVSQGTIFFQATKFHFQILSNTRCTPFEKKTFNNGTNSEELRG